MVCVAKVGPGSSAKTNLRKWLSYTTPKKMEIGITKLYAIV